MGGESLAYRGCMSRTVHPTLLSRLVREDRCRTLEETCAAFERAAREMGEDATLSVRQLRRWMDGNVQPRPVCRRVAERFWGYPIETLLGPAEGMATRLAIADPHRLPSRMVPQARGEPEAGDRTDRRQVIQALVGAALGAGLNPLFAAPAGADSPDHSDSEGEQPPVVPQTGGDVGVDTVVLEALRAIISADLEHQPRGALHDIPPLKALQQRVALVRRRRVECDYLGALSLVPAAVHSLHAWLAKPSPGWKEALRLLVLLEEATASIVRYLGAPLASVIVAEHMQDASRRLGDPLMTALAAFQRAHASTAVGAYDHARTIAERAAEALRSHADEPGGTELLGMLMLTAAYACWRQGERGDTADYLHHARQIADRTGDTMTLSLFFGPTNISIWQISMEAQGGDAGRAVALARRTNPRALPHVQRQATYYMDTARALAQLGRNDEALQMLMEAERLAPAHVRRDPTVTGVVRDLVETRKRNAVPPDARALCERLGITV